MKSLTSFLLTIALMIFPMQTNAITAENDILPEKQFQQPALPLDAIVNTAQDAGIIADTIEQNHTQERVLWSTQATEEDLFKIVADISGSELLAAAMLGNARHESQLIGYRWEGDVYPDENNYFDISWKATEKINKLLRSAEYDEARKLFEDTNPLHNWSGFGCFGFTCLGMKKMLISYCISVGCTDISNREMQFRFVLYYLQTENPGLYKRLQNDTDLYSCVERFAGGFEKCENSEHGYFCRKYYSKQYYELYGGK